MIKSVLASVLTNPVTGRLLRGWHESKRRLGRKPHTIFFYHRAADAWSWLLAQSLPALLKDYNIEVKVRMLSSLPVDCVPDPDQLDSYAAYDAMRLARAWGFSFPDRAAIPERSLSHLAERIILAQPDGSVDNLIAVTAAVWAADSNALSRMAAEYGAVDEQRTTRLLATNARELQRRGHYQSGMIWFQGEWFWGLDRLYLLEERLRARGLNRQDQTLTMRSFRPLPRELAGSAQPLDLEFYFSFRSPYSYLGALRIGQLADRLGLNLVLRPVLPMVTRGIPVPSLKLRYILTDVARLARHQNVPFGPIHDPLGKGVERCLAVLHLADTKGVGRQFMLAAMRAIWTEAADLTRNSTLQRVGAIAGLDSAEIDEAVQNGNWRARVEANGAALAVLGLWGVPGMCLRGPDDKAVTVAWGQDRIWVIERAALGVDVAMPPPRLVQ